MTDPNQPYVPAAYPRMLYATAERQIIVHSAQGEAEARAQGYGDYAEIGPEADGLQTLPREHLYDEAVKLFRASIVRMTTEDLIEAIRRVRAEEVARAVVVAEASPAPDDDAAPASEPQGGAVEPAADSLDNLEDAQLRAMIEQRDGKKPHHKFGRDKLIAILRGQPETAQ